MQHNHKHVPSCVHERADFKKSWIGNCFVTNARKSDIIQSIQQWIRVKDRSRHISSVNLTKLVMMQNDSRLAKSILTSAVNLADGFPIYVATRLLGDPIPERITGIDLMIDLLHLSDRNEYRAFFLGSKQDVLEKVVKKVRRIYPGIVIAGSQNGYFRKEEEAGVAESIGATNPDIIFMALGLPQKEYFILDHAQRLSAAVILPVGGAFDVFIGQKKRAPMWVQKMGGEWIWRSLFDKSKAKHIFINIFPFVKIIYDAMVNRITRRDKSCHERETE